MKNKICLLLVVLLTGSLCGCSSETNNDDNLKQALCSNGSNIVDYLEGNSKKVNVDSVESAKSEYVHDDLCDAIEKIAYYHDKNASVTCGSKDYEAIYTREDSLDDTIEEYESNNYKCVIYDDDSNDENQNIVGSWCGTDTMGDYKYTFNEDGTFTYYILGSTYNGYYSIKDNLISYGMNMMLNNSRDYIIVSKDYFEYDKSNDSLNLVSKMKVEEYNTLKRCS